MPITIFSLIVLLFSVMIHEIAHGSVALALGDPTAKYAGRLTLNPLKHLDLMGSVLIPLMLLVLTMGQGPIFGWAKPVPVNPALFKDKKWGELKVSLAGPAVNFLIATIFGLVLRFIDLPETLAVLFRIICIYNFLWGIFNLVPIPPLDGSHILFSFLPAKYLRFKYQFAQYGFVILIAFLFLGGLDIVYSLALWLFGAVTGNSLVF
ncbi:MAG: site-2 protease family protein [Candidatus Paceibacterota bacterium]